ncbi:hypothetical protein E2C01_022716 [Portunus trituberculatus]|uniref:Secreted protein n=1 Tax=Portunus trituberculatus TaxID=210409 RepID=A0A5B7E647_PORTR|nr:hypothetical protein [Portunus trituberculatus]
MAWLQHVLLLWLVLRVAGLVERSSEITEMRYILAGKGRCVAPVLAQHTASLVSCAALCSRSE